MLLDNRRKPDLETAVPGTLELLEGVQYARAAILKWSSITEKPFFFWQSDNLSFLKFPPVPNAMNPLKIHHEINYFQLGDKLSSFLFCPQNAEKDEQVLYHSRFWEWN